MHLWECSNVNTAQELSHEIGAKVITGEQVLDPSKAKKVNYASGIINRQRRSSCSRILGFRPGRCSMVSIAHA
ncbi:MAG: hypothetical protein GTO43_05000 [Armatimonadetes bacterium]|nr:hypothetical protein [Armatimonadota bacterium]